MRMASQCLALSGASSRSIAKIASFVWAPASKLKTSLVRVSASPLASSAATVLAKDGAAQRSCQLDVGAVAGKTVVTIEGLSPTSSHPLQKAWVVEEVPQCGYCQSGQIMKAAELLAKNPKPSRADIITHMNGNICRCGTYHRIIAAIERAAKEG